MAKILGSITDRVPGSRSHCRPRDAASGSPGIVGSDGGDVTFGVCLPNR